MRISSWEIQTAKDPVPLQDCGGEGPTCAGEGVLRAGVGVSVRAFPEALALASGDAPSPSSNLVETRPALKDRPLAPRFVRILLSPFSSY